ncbi:MAG: hypothetical protein ABSB94_18230 [Syntrophorhabdales bacterium]|jgi:hypothetical protein
MFGFLKNRANDDKLSKEFVRQMFALGRDTCPSIAEGVRMWTDGEVRFPVNDDASLQVSLAIIGTALAILGEGHSKVMTAERGSRIAAACKQAIENDYDLSIDSASKINQALDEYQAAFQRSMASEKNPFGEISGMMLVRCMGKNAMALCVPGTGNLGPLMHQTIGDLMTLTVNQALTFWKGK